MIGKHLSVELPVGSDAWINGVHVIAVRDSSTYPYGRPSCARCVFNNNLCPDLLYCMESERRDHENVHFERIFKR